MISLNVNGKRHDVDAPPKTPLLWVIRENLGLTGTKFGCGKSLCGACTVHADGKAIRSCVTPLSSVSGKNIVTIEGLSPDGSHPVQQAWIAEDVPQCGYCHSGQIMAAAALLADNPSPSDDEIHEAMAGNICRCGTYQRIRRAIHRAGKMMAEGGIEGSAGSPGPRSAGPFALNDFVHIGTDGVITLIINKSEMGQGVYTSLPMLVAEELECDWDMIRVEPAPVAPVYNHTVMGIQLTGGSSSVYSEWERMRRVGAAAREMLAAAAADIWKVDRKSCHAENGRIIHTSGKTLSYGQLAEKASEMQPPRDIPLKDPSSFKIVGKPRRRLDNAEKVTGKAIFGLDANVPGALIALVARPPVFGGKVKRVEDREAKSTPGVKAIVRIESGVAVVAENFWSAKEAREKLEITWDNGPLSGLSTSGMRQEYSDLAGTPGVVAMERGTPDETLGQAAVRIDADYEVPYLAHAPMEPLNCLVDLRSDSCEIWTGTQFQTVDRNAAAREAGREETAVQIHTTFLGGGFGRRANPRSDFVVEAVQVAKAVKKPVKIVWTREDDIKGGYYRPMWYDRLAAGLDQNGDLVAWKHRIVGQSIIRGSPFEQFLVAENGIDGTSVEGAQDTPYEIPNLLVDLHTPEIGVPVQWWRSVGHSHTAFVVESFMDEAAYRAGKDPYEFRRRLLANHPRHRRVLELAAEKAGWSVPAPEGKGWGIAVHESFGSIVAEAAEVSVNSEGKPRVHKVVCAIDCGSVVNPATVEAQMESGIVFGLSATLYGAVTFKDGRVEQSNFNDYPVLRTGEMPVIEVYIVPSREAPGGVGEPGTPPIAPAVTNALFALTGKRIRRLPIDPEALKI
jgi:isoquinoline 1-oxidoreductase beta subunit